ncbi:MAG: DUF4124 domain-containing protein [Gammaproteobacteria bacterium]|nr:DUF4124 domain-containing protein [Gammaproteobacteria bacterium]
MKHCSLLLAAACLLITGASSAQSIYKCTNADGTVSFQDRACPGETSSATVQVDRPTRKAKSDYDGKVINVPGVGEAAILVFDYMETIVRDDGGQATTIGIRSKRGARDKMSLMMTLMPNPRGEMPSRAEHEAAVADIILQQTGGRLGFGGFEMNEFMAKSGTGLFAVLADPSYPRGVAPDGEYATMTVGQIADERFVAAITILSDGTDNKGFTDALSIAETFVVAPGVVAINHESGDLSLPDAPAGFSWHQAREIKGAFLRPDGWHLDTRHDDDDYAYFISREPNTEPDGFDTGLTINVTTNVPQKTGMPASLYAAEFIRTGAGELEIIGEPFSSRRGPFESHGALFTAKDPEKGDFNAHMVAIANDTTGTVYFCIFEGPAENWEQTWRMGEIMLQKLAIDDSI